MKANILILFIIAFHLYSQNYEPAQFAFEFDGDTNYYLSHDSSYFKQNNFILGWAWSYGKKMSEAMQLSFETVELQTYCQVIHSSFTLNLAKS